jgi:hypothetical protein
MSRSRRARIVAVLVIASGAGAFVLRSQRPAPTIERVVLLGFDGVAPNLMEPLLAQGKLPTIQRLMAEGTYAPLHSFHPCKSGVLWTSIATGKTMLKHGILDWTYVNDHGIALPYEDTGRRVKTYWEILAERGIKTGTLNWWVSYPPPPIAGGFLVSNAFRKRPDPDTVSPPSLFDWINPVRLPYEAVPDEMKREGFPIWKKEDATVPLGAAESVLQSYATYFGQDVTVDRASDYLWTHQPVQVFSTYFRLPDVTSHFVGHYVDRALYDEVVSLDEQGKPKAAAVARLDADMARLLAPAYQRMDRTVAKYLDRLDDRTLLLVCSDHGFAFFGGGYNHYNPAMEAPDGVLFLRGPGIRKGGRLKDPRLFDIAPTILHAMGQPVAEDMDGTVLRDAYEPAYLKRHPVRTITTYEGSERRAGAPSSHKSDEEILDDLRTLGYIDAGKPTPGPAPAP